MESAPKRVSRAYVGFGANLGDPAATLRAAAAELGRRAGPLAAASPHLPLPDPSGVTDQPPFLNAVAALETELDPDALLEVLLAVEAAYGRVRDVRWGPRTLDLDLIWFEGVRARRRPPDAAAPARARARVRAAPAVRPRPGPAARAAGRPATGSPRSTRRASSATGLSLM